MKQSLQLRLGQKLTMTPQLQQAIKLLQLSTLDMQQEIQQALDSNYMLEVENEDEADDFQKPVENSDSLSQENEGDLITSHGSEVVLPDDLPIDTTWADIYDNAQTMPVNGTADRPDYQAQYSEAESLQDYLFWQLEFVSFSEREQIIASSLIDNISDDGYLIDSLDVIWQSLIPQLEELFFSEVEAVLHRVQNFDPPGVAAIDLSDCLRLQLQHKALPEEIKEITLRLVTDHLELLASNNRQKLMRKLAVTIEQLKDIIAIVRSLDPKPGAILNTVLSDYVVPDVYVVRLGKGKWQVELNPDVAPKIRVNALYSGMVKRADESTDNISMRNQLQEARWFIKSLRSRNDTILRVAKSIVEKQVGFLENGPIAMKPMILKDIAEELDLHESTISRVTTQKYMHTVSGVFEFKYFFSSHVSTAGGGECSAIAIRSFIKELIDEESPEKPLSDSKIAAFLNEKGINVARRTIAKYREGMSIPSSSQRKRLS